MGRSRLEERKIAEAAEKRTTPAKKKKAKRATKKRKTTTRAKRAKDAPQRKKLVWAVFSANMKEEGRFAYDERDKAEEKLTALRAKSKKLYFIQPLKEVLADAEPVAPPSPEELEIPKSKTRSKGEEE